MSGSVQVMTSAAFVSQFNIIKPEKRVELLQYQSNELLFTDFLQVVGATRRVYNQTYSYFVEDKIVRNITSSTSVTENTLNTAADITLTAADHSADGLYSYPQVGMVLRTKNGKQLTVTEKDSSTPDAHVITVLPKTGTAIGTIGAGEKIATISINAPIGSSGVQPYTSTFTEITNQLSIFKENVRITGSALEDALWVEIADPTGMGKGKALLVNELIAAEKRFKNAIEVGMMVHEYDDLTNAAFVAMGTFSESTIHMTRGLLPSIEGQGGIVSQYAPGEPSLQYMRKLTNTITANYGDKEYTYWQGQVLRQSNTDWIADVNKNGAIVYGAFGGDKEIAFKLGFDSIYLDGFTFHQKNYELFNNPDQLNSSGYDYTKRGFMVPVKNVNTVGANGSIIKGRPINICYKDVYNGQMARTWVTDGARFLAQPTSSNDVVTFDMIAEQGFEMLGIWKFVSVKPSN